MEAEVPALETLAVDEVPPPDVGHAPDSDEEGCPILEDIGAAEEHEEPEERDSLWSDDVLETPIPAFIPAAPPGPADELSLEKVFDPLYLLLGQLGEEFFHLMTTQTNLYESQVEAQVPFDHPQCPREWEKLLVPELMAWYGIATIHSIVPVPQVKMFWGQHTAFASDLVPQAMSLVRFEQIRR
jgi:hypothetical protein